MLTCHLQSKGESKTECPFLMYRLLVKTKHLPLLPTVNVLLAEFTHFNSLLPSTYKFGTVYCLHTPLQMFTNFLIWTKLLYVCLKEVCLKSYYSEDYINKCFKKFMDNIRVVKETTLTVKKKSLVLVYAYLGSIFLQTRTKLKKSLKYILNFCQLQIVFKNKTRLGSNFHFKDRISEDLSSDIVYKFQCGLCNES